MTAILLVCTLCTVPCAGEDWRAFRGSLGNGTSAAQQPVTHWGQTDNVAWRVPLPGSGNGSAIVVGDRVLLTCAQQLGKRRTLHCLHTSDGRELWARSVAVDEFELTHRDNPHCGTTPVSDGKVVVVWHGTGGLHCYTLDGELVWSRNLGTIKHLWGYGNSPVIHDNRVILHSGAGSEFFAVALRLADGATIWRAVEPGGQANETPDGELTGSWSTPVFDDSGGTTLAVCSMPTRVVAFDVEDGEASMDVQRATGAQWPARLRISLGGQRVFRCDGRLPRAYTWSSPGRVAIITSTIRSARKTTTLWPESLRILSWSSGLPSRCLTKTRPTLPS